MIRPAAFAMTTLGAAAFAASVSAVLILALAPRANAQGLNYVDGDDFFAPNLSPLSAINSSGTANDTDNLWGFRSGFGAASTVFQSGLSEDSPELTQMVTGLTPGVSYDLYAVYWTDKDENWTIRTGATSGNLTLYSFTGPAGGVAGSTKGLTAGAAVWTTPPPATAEGTLYTQRPADLLVMLLGKAGTATADGSGQINVFVDDLANAGGGNRAWFDGVAYVNAGTQVALTASIDRATGALTITNPTSQNFQIKAITLDSPNGALSTTGWTPVSNRLDGNGNMTFDTHVWNATTPATMPFAAQLAEAEDASGGGSGGTLAAGGGTIGLGNVWARSPFEDIRLSLTLADDTLAMISPQFTGASIAQGDFNRDGAINLGDYQIMMTNMHTTLTTTSNAEAFLSGDMTADRNINFNDFASFRTAYDLANGAGAFEQMVAQIPEPTSLGMLAIAGAFAAKLARRRRMTAVAAVAMCCLVASTSQAQTLLKVDVDARAGDSTAGPPGDNTVPTFGSFTLTPATTGAQPSSTGVVNGYTISVLAVNASGVAQPGIDDRDRGGPTTAPTLNQLYDDFIFTAGGVGLGGGIDLTVQGGALVPNTAYNFSLYSFDPTSTAAPQPRTADWLDGNQGDVRSFSTSFSGATSPTTDNQYRFTGLAVTDASGRLFLRGRSTTGVAGQPGVFVNGFEINPFTGLTLEVNSTTGAVRILNEQSAPIQLSYYEIRSATGALNPAGWSSLDDAEGGDPLGTGWDEAGGSGANVLSEGNLTGSLTVAASGGSANLGSAFSVGGATNLSFSYAAPDGGALQLGFVKYVTGGANDADFDNDTDVDGNDFLIWQRGVGVGNSNATGDANASGTVDGADLAVWRSQFGPASVAAAAAIPEPGSLVLLVCAGIGGVIAGRVSTIRRQ